MGVEKRERDSTEEERGNSSSSSSRMDTGRAEAPVWLMKCPVVVAKSWSSHNPSDPHPIAKVVLSFDPLRADDPSAMEFKMEMPGSAAANLPQSYSLNMFKDFVPMCVFSETNQGKVSVEGKVDHKFDMKPHGTNIEEYGKLCRERTNKSMIKNRQIQMIDNDRGVLMRPMPGMIGLVSSTSKDKKKTAPVKQSDMKRTRRDRGELEDIVFKLFEQKQPNWTLKQLVQETNQPAQFLKEILNELCVYNKRERTRVLTSSSQNTRNLLRILKNKLYTPPNRALSIVLSRTGSRNELARRIASWLRGAAE